MKPPSLRCAIYTRKSTDEGLDQAFNSLHAQREACEAYVLSQAGEGWVVHPTAYDDGGISGGTMNRPALQQLLEDIGRGLIDVVVVYKVDRLTRSLADFAKIVERFDKRGVSFVSVTQAFNTTNSMGRLTLNVLLSFAQFEREVTGERIRDKIAASKKKGMWMGGNLPLGYNAPTDPQTRALVLNPDEAPVVRRIFERYLELGSVHALKAELDAEGARTKVTVSKTGNRKGGVPYGRGPLFHLLRNRVYLGEIVHRGQGHPASHPPIVDPALFDQVQARLDGNVAERRQRRTKPEGSPLTGLISDAEGLPMTPAIAYGKAGRKYRYYVSRPLQLGGAQALQRDVIRRVAAGAIEGLVMDRLHAVGLLAPAAGWAQLRDLLAGVRLGADAVTLTLHRSEAMTDAVLAEVRQALNSGEVLTERDGKAPRVELIIPGRAACRGGRTWIAGAQGEAVVRRPKPDPTLLNALRRAHEVADEHGLGPLGSAQRNAEPRAVADAYLRSIAQLAYLAPDIQAAIVEGRQPAGLTLEQLRAQILPMAWAEQRAVLGFKAASA